MMVRRTLLGFFLLISLSGISQERGISIIGNNGWKLWLDREASWKNDKLHLPPVDVSTIKINPPTCGWDRLFSNPMPATQAKKVVNNPSMCLEVNVPGTVEEYCWDAISKKGGKGNSGDYIGVSWWGTGFKVPSNAKGRRVKLFFSEGIRQRAEVFVNQKLVGYELIHQTPFKVDITDVVKVGAVNQLAVRVTDPGGNFSWGDYIGEKWGDYLFPLSHGFGGILGEVQLQIIPNLYVADAFVKNKPELTGIDVELELKNEGLTKKNVSIEVAIVEAWQHNKKINQPEIVYQKTLGEYDVLPGQNKKVEFQASVPEAKLWGIKDANLYNLVTTLKDGDGKTIDSHTQRFGFRFLSVEGYGTENPCFYLNGKRTFFISSISWGFWPVNGIYPTPELARKHIESAFALGQNMLNFHRCQGNTCVLNLADEMGMLYYEEPGGYSSSRINEGSDLHKLKHKNLAQELNFQRLLRLVKRDRNHPSLVYYNLVNEPGWTPNEATKQNMAEAHRLDPTRFKSYGSGFMAIGKDEPLKLHMLPYDHEQRTLGYCDLHNAGNSPGVYMDEMYNSPDDFIRNEKAKGEIFVWGEEGALASPPQLEVIYNKIKDNQGLNGWDGADYKDWYQSYQNYITGKGLKKYYPSITELITSMADVMYYEHGRTMENARIADDAEIYIYNGYEDMKNDNFSGAVDIYRNLKGTPELLSYYAQPLYVAVKVREKIGHVGDVNLFDMYIINEHAIPKGEYKVKAVSIDPLGNQALVYNGKTKVTGGDVFSDFVAEKVAVELNAGIGYYKIKAELYGSDGNKLAEGHDEVFAVDWKTGGIKGKGAIIGDASNILKFVQENKPANLVEYKDGLGKLDYILAADIDQGAAYQPVPSVNFRATDNKTLGLEMDYFRGMRFEKQVDHRVSTATIDFDSKEKVIPGYDILGDTKFSVKWEGFILAVASGETGFELTIDDGARVWFDGEKVIDEWNNGAARSFRFKKNLVKGKAYPIKIDAFQDGGDWKCAFKWKLPIEKKEYDMDTLLQRVKDGTKLILMEDAEEWMALLKQERVVPGYKVFHPGKSWVGSSFFVREHPFFNELPTNDAMNWEYQRLVMYNGPKHFGLYDMEGENPVVSLVGSPFHKITTSVGVIPYGKGKVVFSSLDLIPNLSLQKKAAHVPKKIFCNLLRWASEE